MHRLRRVESASARIPVVALYPLQSMGGEAMLLDGKAAVVTGAGRGLGAGIARGFAREGCSVALCDINEGGARQVAEEIHQTGARTLVLKCDVSSPREARTAIEDTIKLFGRLDILANVAGISPKKDGRKIPFYEIPPEQWQRVLALNLSSCLYMSAAAPAKMIAQRSGRIISMSSIAGKTGSEWGPAGAHYSASKAGVIALTRSMAFELAPYGITVNAVAPGRIQSFMATDTAEDVNRAILERIPMGRFGTMDEVVNVFIFLASEAASYITGETVDVNGGWLIG